MNLQPDLAAVGVRHVPYSVVASSGLEPEATAPVLIALEWVLDALRLTDRIDPVTIIVANKLIELAKAGERDTQRLCDLALQAIQSGLRIPTLLPKTSG